MMALIAALASVGTWVCFQPLKALLKDA
jgi:hypothetical protein